MKYLRYLLQAIIKADSPFVDQPREEFMTKQSTAVTRQIILLYNMDSGWSRSEQKEVCRLVEKMQAGLEEQKYHVQPVEVHDNLAELEAYDPLEWLVFNWCEGFAGLPWSDSLVAKELETRGFAFTGSGSKILRKNQDKWRVKRALHAAKVPTPTSRVMKSAVEAEEWGYFAAGRVRLLSVCGLARSAVYIPRQIHSKITRHDGHRLVLSGAGKCQDARQASKRGGCRLPGGWVPGLCTY